jgi:hypothetical protein
MDLVEALLEDVHWIRLTHDTCEHGNGPSVHKGRGFLYRLSDRYHDRLLVESGQRYGSIVHAHVDKG